MLKPLSHRHAPALQAILSHPLVRKYNDIPTFCDLAEFRSYLQYDLALWYQNQGGRWVIEYNKDVIGSCGIYNYNQTLEQAEIGFELHPDYWHQGFMSEVLVSILDYLRAQDSGPKVNILIARCDINNGSSLKLLSKFHFTLRKDKKQTYELVL